MKTLNFIEKANEADLLAAIDLLRDDETKEGKKEVNNAIAEILRRHERYIYGTITNVLGGIRSLSPDEIYFHVVERIYKLAGHFHPRSCDSDAMQKQFRSWVGKIASLVAREQMRLIPKESQATDLLLRSFSQTEDNNFSDSDKVFLIRNKMSEVLTKKEQEVLRAWMLVIPLDGRQSKMKKQDVDNICNALDTTPQNFRQIKSRALKTLKSALEPHITY